MSFLIFIYGVAFGVLISDPVNHAIEAWITKQIKEEKEKR